MTAQLDQSATIYHCIVCGPCLRFDVDDDTATITVHDTVAHPATLTYDEEDNPQ